MNLITASIVLYKQDNLLVEKVVNSFFKNCLNCCLYLIDNSPTNDLESLFYDQRIEYIHNPSNPGFGASHNIAINLATKSGSKYHFIINPDIYFEMEVVTPMVNYMERNVDVGMMMPEVLNPDGSVQYLPKLLPNPFWIFWRKIKKPSDQFKRFIEKYELRNFPKDKIYNAPILSGCFTLLNLNAIAEVGAYDDKYFMYFEDFDLSRRMHKLYKTVYFPLVSVYHGYEGGANKRFKLFKIFLASAIIYFNKWGWFFDKERRSINENAYKQLCQKV